MVKELSVQEQKYRAVMAVLADGRSVSEVAGQWGVSRQSVHAWLRRYEEAGLAGLEPRSTRPSWCPHQMSGVVEARILEMRRAHPGWGPRRILYELQRVGGAVPSRSAIYRCLVRAGLIVPQARRRRDEHWKRWERGEPMELWQMDTVGGFLLADGRRAKALTGIDDHSRFCVSAYLVLRETAQRVCDGLALAMRTYGVPEEILTDNGKVFTGRFNRPPVEVLFDRVSGERDHPSAHRAALADHHGEGGAVPPHATCGVPYRPGLRGPDGRAGRAGCVGGGVQPAAAALGDRDGPAGRTVRPSGSPGTQPHGRWSGADRG